MRLSESTKHLLKQVILKGFGNICVYLFGSRVDDRKEGCDIDLSVFTYISDKKFQKEKIKFITSLVMKNFKIDVDLIKYPCNKELLNDKIKNKLLNVS